ncbi:metallophosphoesterase [Haloparvum sp. AD34]
MLVGIVSDTHDNLDLVQAAVGQFEYEGVDVVVHCGDVVSPFSATPFDGDWDFYAVRGNNDGEWALQDTVTDFGTYLGEAGSLTLDGVDLAVYHGTSETLTDALVESGDYDVVCHGHTHRHDLEGRGGTVRVNPGGLPIPGRDDVFRVATLDTETLTVEHHELNP